MPFTIDLALFIKNEVFPYTHTFINIEKQKTMRDECVFLQRSAFLMGFFETMDPLYVIKL